MADILLMAKCYQGRRVDRIGSIIESREDGALVFRYNLKVPLRRYKTLRVHPAALGYCLQKGVKRIEIEMDSGEWLCVTPEYALEEGLILPLPPHLPPDFHIPLKKWGRIPPQTSVFVATKNAEVVILDWLDPQEIIDLFGAPKAPVEETAQLNLL